MAVVADELEVSLHSERIGLLRRAPRRSREFVALDAVQPPQGGVRLAESFALIGDRPPDVDLLSRFLGGYLPEGAQRSALAAKRGIASYDLLAFLREFGSSLAGAVTFRDPDTAPDDAEARYTPVTDKLLRRHLRRAVEEHDLGIRDDSRSMLAGFQPKVLVTRFGEGPWVLPHGSGHSTHILKPRLRSRPTRIVDEFYSHELARAVDLAGFASWLQGSGEGMYLAVERFDRVVHEGRVDLVHQEDAAQALALGWTDDDLKFQSTSRPADPARPSAYRIAELAGSLRDVAAVEQWIRQLLFRIMIGDNDGHAKNVGILHLPGADRLTDLYDAVPNLFQEDRIDWTMALAVDGEFDHRRVSVDRILAEIDGWRLLGGGRAEKIVEELLSSFRDALNVVPVPRGVSPRLPDVLVRTADRLLRGDEIGTA